MSNRTLHFSDSFVISCGTVTLDLKARKVLLIRWRKRNEYLLPKGRKDVGETLEQAALRETYEETGYRAQLLPLEISTLATLPVIDMENHAGAKGDSGGHEPRMVRCSEPIAIQQRITRQGKHKIIFWFVAEGVSSLKPDEGTQLDYEDIEPIWASIDESKRLMSYEDDAQIIEKVIKLARSKDLFLEPAK